MDCGGEGSHGLGIGGKSALVCAASKGLGKACAMSLAREGVAVTIVARTLETLEAAGGEIHAQTGAYNVTINNLLPGAFDTDRLRSPMEAEAKASGRSFDEVYRGHAEATPACRFGTPAEFGDACAYLCSAQAGYITGQNLLMDGGAYLGTF
jgi:NAD(P)-dependent dehydrogenase (short-subunit alcohol dehydrogenase family)